MILSKKTKILENSDCDSNLTVDTSIPCFDINLASILEESVTIELILENLENFQNLFGFSDEIDSLYQLKNESLEWIGARYPNLLKVSSHLSENKKDEKLNFLNSTLIPIDTTSNGYEGLMESIKNCLPGYLSTIDHLTVYNSREDGRSFQT